MTAILCLLSVLPLTAAQAVEPPSLPDLVLVRTGTDALPGDGLWLRSAHGAWSKIVDADGGIIADPAVDPSGRRIAFAWRRRGSASFRLALVDLTTARVTAVTPVNEVVGDDRSPAWLADGTLVFRSTRMGQAAPDGDLAGALFLIASDGKFQRRVTWDQDVVGAPQVLDDGRILYLRTDGVGRPTYPVAMTMHADGTNQKPWYSWQDSRLPHPDVLFGAAIDEDALYAGMTAPDHAVNGSSGDAVLRAVWKINSLAGRRFPAGAALAATGGSQGDVRDPCRIPGVGWVAMIGSGTTQVVGFGHRYGEWVGRIEMPASGDAQRRIWRQPQAVQPRRWYGSFPSVVDHRQPTGYLYIQDIAMGDGMPGGLGARAAQVRLVALQWPLAGAGHASPTAHIVGTAPVETDGSLFVQVPAATPLMVQVLDANGSTVGRMHSWMALQPGERLSCVGCHTSERQAPPMGKPVAAFLREPRTLTAPGRQALAFATAIAPLVRQECGSCHGATGTGTVRTFPEATPAQLHTWLATSGWLRETKERRPPFLQVVDATGTIPHPPVRLAPEVRDVLAAWCDIGSPGPQPDIPDAILTRAAAWAREEGLAIRAYNLHRFGKIEQ